MPLKNGDLAATTRLREPLSYFRGTKIVCIQDYYLLFKSPHEGRKKGRRIAMHEWIVATATRATTTCEAAKTVLAAKKMFFESSQSNSLGCYSC
jgi:hypothetical protein